MEKVNGKLVISVLVDCPECGETSTICLDGIIPNTDFKANEVLAGDSSVKEYYQLCGLCGHTFEIGEITW
jgi:hypothetical protein